MKSQGFVGLGIRPAFTSVVGADVWFPATFAAIVFVQKVPLCLCEQWASPLAVVVIVIAVIALIAIVTVIAVVIIFAAVVLVCAVSEAALFVLLGSVVPIVVGFVASILIVVMGSVVTLIMIIVSGSVTIVIPLIAVSAAAVSAIWVVLAVFVTVVRTGWLINLIYVLWFCLAGCTTGLLAVTSVQEFRHHFGGGL